MNTRFASPAVLLLTLWAAAVPTAWAQGTQVDFLRTNPRFLETFRPVVAAPSRATVRVRNDDQDAALGVVVDPDGWILTKAFDLKGKLTCRLRDGREPEARLVGVHAIHDVALLKIDAHGLPAVRLQPSKKVPVGAWVASVGQGEDPVAVGVVSVPTRNVLARGLPLPAAELSKIPYLGVGLEPADGRGVRVTQVMPGTAAAKAGLQVNDIIARVAGAATHDPEQFQFQLIKHRPGDLVTLHILRDDEELDVEARFQRRPAGDNRGELQNNMGSQLSSRRSGYPTILTHDSVVKPADCGGPLVDLDGNVIGINISRAGRTESWTIPSEVLLSLLPELRSGRLAPAEALPPANAVSDTERPPASRPGSEQPAPRD